MEGRDDLDEYAKKSRKYERAVAASPTPKRIRKKAASVSAVTSFTKGFSLATIIKMHALFLKYADEMGDKGVLYAKQDSCSRLEKLCVKGEKKARNTAALYKKVELAVKGGENSWEAVKRIFDLRGGARDRELSQAHKNLLPREIKKKRRSSITVNDLVDSPNEALSDGESDGVEIFSAVAFPSELPSSDEGLWQPNDILDSLDFFAESENFEEAFLSTIDSTDISDQALYNAGFQHASMGLQHESMDPAYYEGYLAAISQLFQ